MKICILGFDHGRYDKRIVAKDISHLKNYAQLLYIYREDIKSQHQSFRQEFKNTYFCGLVKKGKGILSRKKFEDEIIKVALDFNPDIFYLHGMFITFPVERLKVLAKRGKVIYDAHEYDPEPVAIQNKYIKNLVEYLIKIRDKKASPYINCAFSVSPSLCNYLQLAGYQNVFLKPNVSPIQPLKPYKYKERHQRLIIAGGLQEERGPEKILRVMSCLVKNMPGIKLNMYVNMSTDLSLKLQKIIKELELTNSVFIEGLIPYDELIGKLASSLGSFMSFPTGIWKTNYISLPNRFYDTLAAGTPIISSSSSIDVSSLAIENNLGPVFIEECFDESINDLQDFLTNESRFNNTLDSINLFAQQNTWEETKKVLDQIFQIN
ncbi:MAG: hypothetical protein ACOYVD_13720 [Bacillota bacterium]